MASAHIRCIGTDVRLALPSPSMILAKAVKIGPDGDEEVSILKTRSSGAKRTFWRRQTHVQSALTFLGLAFCIQVSDLSRLAGLTQLTSLNLKGCNKISDLRPLPALTQLTSLNLSDCGQVSDLGPLAGLTYLTSLNIGSCVRVRDLSPLIQLPNLKSIIISQSMSAKLSIPPSLRPRVKVI